ncbi:hypothetical protein VXM60_19375 [Shewanella khirikhana]|uniref:hypothetical protein n=1 Tax=Shewanella khirikhana TaxID=1965282 RepID=UPI0030CB9A30
MRVVHHSDAYLDDIGLIVEPRQALANIRSSLRREPGCHPYISGLDSMLCNRGLGACITPHQVDNLLEDIRPLINRGDYFLLSGRGDLEGVLFFERSSPFLSNEFQHKLQSLPPRPQWSAASTSNSSSSFFEDAIDGLVGAGKQVLNDFIAGQRASQAEWFAEQGIIQATDKATGQALSSEELAERYREIETVSISPAQQGGADAIQSLRGYEAGLLVAEAAVNRKKIITDTKEIKDAIVDAVKDTKAQTKVDLDDIGSTATDLGVVPNTFERPTIGTQIDDQVRLVDTAKLPPWTVETFRNGEFVTVETTESVTLFRKFGGGPSQAKLDGAYASTVQNASRQETAVYPAWSNSRFEAELVVPNGQTLSIGAVGQQPPNSLVPKYRGGADQILLPRNWATDWVKSVRDGKTGIVYSFDEFKTAFPDQVSRGK